MHFVDGLCDDIRAAVYMQRPSSVDVAYVLALLQEELVDPWHQNPPSKSMPPLPPAPTYNGPWWACHC